MFSPIASSLFFNVALDYTLISSNSLPVVVTQIWVYIGSLSPTHATAYAFIIVARKIQVLVLPSSTRVEWYLPTLIGALKS